jgi:DNA-binding MarR family transcriptional regulator
MKNGFSDEGYRALSELRYRIRHFIQEGDAAARESNLEPQQYLMLLAIRGLPEGSSATIRTLAERLALKHHSAVELIDRLESHRLVHRNRSEDDRREVLVSLLPRGAKLLEQVARRRLGELRASGAALADAINTLVERKVSLRRSYGSKRLSKSTRANGLKKKAAARGQKMSYTPSRRSRNL